MLWWVGTLLGYYPLAFSAWAKDMAEYNEYGIINCALLWIVFIGENLFLCLFPFGVYGFVDSNLWTEENTFWGSVRKLDHNLHHDGHQVDFVSVIK